MINGNVCTDVSKIPTKHLFVPGTLIQYFIQVFKQNKKLEELLFNCPSAFSHQNNESDAFNSVDILSPIVSLSDVRQHNTSNYR